MDSQPRNVATIWHSGVRPNLCSARLEKFQCPGALGINVCMTPREVKLSKTCFHIHSYHNSVKVPGCVNIVLPFCPNKNHANPTGMYEKGFFMICICFWFGMSIGMSKGF